MARIELDHVSKVYGGIVQAVDALTLDIADEDFLVIVGPRRLREIDGAADGGRPGGHHRG